MFALARSLVYATMFVGGLLVWLPLALLERSGTPPPTALGATQFAGLASVVAGAVLIAWCIGSFALIGRGTPAPFDAPRRLVIRGPYRFVRNPMYTGAFLVLVGGASYFESGAILGYAAVFLIAVHLFVIGYEEPALRRSFGEDYENYCREVRRWLPGYPSG